MAKFRQITIIMKTIKQLLAALIVVVLPMLGFTSSADTEDGEDPYWGVISMLQYAKNFSEQAFTIEYLELTTDERAEMIRRYDSLKTQFDMFIGQLVAQLRIRNRLGIYRYLDRQVFKKELQKEKKSEADKKKRVQFEWRLVEAISSFKRFVSWVESEKIGQTPSSTWWEGSSPTDVGGFAFGVYKLAQETRIKKVEKICGMLDSLRFKASSELIGKEKKKSGGK